MISQVLLFRRIIHCKFLVFVLIVFFLFSFFLRACEFRFIERIGAPGKQNPDFIIMINAGFLVQVVKEVAICNLCQEFFSFCIPEVVLILLLMLWEKYYSQQGCCSKDISLLYAPV